MFILKNIILIYTWISQVIYFLIVITIIRLWIKFHEWFNYEVLKFSEYILYKSLFVKYFPCPEVNQLTASHIWNSVKIREKFPMVWYNI